MGKRVPRQGELPVGNNGTVVPFSSEDFWSAFGEIEWFVGSILETDAKTPRVTGSVSLFYQDSGLKSAVRDRASGKVAFVWANSLFTLLCRVQSGLRTGQLDWRPDRFAPRDAEG
jgi:hypothetical protein